MTEFVLLRPTLYSYEKLDGSEDKKCKGIKKCVVKKTSTFEDYKNCLFEDSTEYRGHQGPYETPFCIAALDPHGVYRSQLMFQSIRHEIFTLEVHKVALNKDDDKHIAKKDGISTLARGHKDLSWSSTLRELFLIEKR